MANKVPANLVIEKQVISAACVDKENAKLIQTKLELDDFYDAKYRAIFNAIEEVHKKEIEYDLSNIIAILTENGDLERIGGVEFINSLIDEYLSDEGLENLCNILIDKKNARNLILKMRDLDNQYFKKEFKDDSEFLAKSEKEVRAITGNRKVDGFTSLKETAAKLKYDIELAMNRKEDLVGIDTGYSQLNRKTLGLEKGEMIIIAASPNVGKTTLAIDIAVNAAKKTKKPVLFYSLEMSELAIGRKIVSYVSSIPGKKIQTGRFDNNEAILLEDTLNNIKNLPLYIDDSANLKINEIINKSRKFKQEHPDLQAIFIDYLGRISPDQKYESMRVQIGSFSHQLKSLAAELQIPVVVLSQLRRVNDGTGYKRPELTDLKESGDIEADADKVLLIHRNDYGVKNSIKYEKMQNGQDSNSENPEFDEPKEDNQAVMAEIHVAKNRNGSTGACYLWFFRECSKFSEPTDDAIKKYKEGLLKSRNDKV